LKLIRYRRQVLYLDSALKLTYGSPVGLTSFLPSLHPDRGIFTAISHPTEGGSPLIGQMRYNRGDRPAKLTCFLPFDIAHARAFPPLLEGLAWQAGQWGAFALLAEIDDLNPGFEALRRAAFSVYAWQEIWKLPAPVENSKALPAIWQAAAGVDEISIHSLYQSLVPPLVQGAEGLPNRRPGGLVFRQDNNVLAYVEDVYGPEGIFLQPLIHPDVKNIDTLLSALVRQMPSLLGRPVYLAMRSYQAWLQSSLEQLGAQVAPRQALMVKHLAHIQRVPVTNGILSTVDKTQTETAPMVHARYDNTSTNN